MKNIFDNLNNCILILSTFSLYFEANAWGGGGTSLRKIGDSAKGKIKFYYLYISNIYNDK